MPEAVHLRIAGRVQGVGYRAWLEHKARGANLRGWVRNRLDGSVEALLIGDAPVIEAVATACERGPRAASVTVVQRTIASDDGSAGFRTLPTL
jgi:acylphosphatase